MKSTLLLVTAAFWVNYLIAAEPRQALLTAAKNLADKPNFSWKLTVEGPTERTGTIDGKAEKDGPIFLSLARGDQGFDGVLKGGKGAIKTEEGWKSLTEVAQESGRSGPAQFVAQLLQNFKTPPDEVADVASKTKELAFADGVYTGTLTEEAAKELLMYRTRPGPNGPQLSSVQGSAKFWLKDGVLSKYEFTLRGTVSSNGNERELNRTQITEIKDIGTTKVNIPEEAAKKL
jgi:hypothetical protein